jgi:Na+-transporting methylmalonyl-CoA/oxaloacetate decarboxylase gamma subunit
MSHLYAIATGSAPLLVGLSIAIVALLLISLFLQIFPRQADRSVRGPAIDASASAPAVVHSAVPVESDHQLVAVITAALAAYLSTQETVSSIPAAGFRVRRIRRIR